MDLIYQNVFALKINYKGCNFFLSPWIQLNKEVQISFLKRRFSWFCSHQRFFFRGEHLTLTCLVLNRGEENGANNYIFKSRVIWHNYINLCYVPSLMRYWENWWWCESNAILNVYLSSNSLLSVTLTFEAESNLELSLFNNFPKSANVLITHVDSRCRGEQRCRTYNEWEVLCVCNVWHTLFGIFFQP